MSVTRRSRGPDFWDLLGALGRVSAPMWQLEFRMFSCEIDLMDIFTTYFLNSDLGETVMLPYGENIHSPPFGLSIYYIIFITSFSISPVILPLTKRSPVFFCAPLYKLSITTTINNTIYNSWTKLLEHA